METKFAQTKIGIMVLTGLVIVIGAIIWGKSISFSRSFHSYRILFPNVIGLDKGANVLVNGVPRGRVSDFELRNDGVIVIVNVKENVEIFSDAYALIETPSLMESKVVALAPGASGQPLNGEGLIPGRPQFSYNQMVTTAADIAESITSTLDEIRETAAALKSTVQNPGLVEIVDNLNASSGELRELIAHSRHSLDSTLAGVNNVTASAGKLIDSNRANIDTILSNFSAFSHQMRGIAAAMDTIAQSVTNEQGTLGKLAKDDELYLNLLKTLDDLDSLIIYIREQGVKTKFSLF